MSTLLIAIGAGLAFIIAYHTYGRWLGKKIFNLSANYVCPSYRLRDDLDYVPTDRGVVFGHHFTSIAGTGPIVGPAIAVMWGWIPALLWVILGSIFIGAVHDFGSLIVSLRNNGQTVGDIAGRVLNKRVRLLFLFVLFLALTIVLAIFGLVIAAVFKMYPSAIFPCLIQIPIAVIIGSYLHKQGKNLLIPSLIALAIMYLTVIYGDVGFLHTFNTSLASWPIIGWVIVLLLYSYVASVLPVWLLLQPRDYINSLQLITALGLIVVGLTIASLFGGAPTINGVQVMESGAPPTLEIIGPAFNFSPAGAPLIFPFLFITIACGAISGFHCLVSSGTTSKQLKNEVPDAQFVGYGGMLLEGFLATLVIIACVAGLGLGVKSGDTMLFGEAAWEARYSSWNASNGLGAKVGAFVDGSGNFLVAMGFSKTIANALMGVLVASFAGTTLDTACRLQRYVVQELAATFVRQPAADAVSSDKTEQPLFGLDAIRITANPATWFTNKHAATIFAIIVATIIAALPAGAVEKSLITHIQDDGITGIWSFLTTNAGKGGLLLWPMFGATNQLLGGLAFLVITFYLWRRNKPVWFVLLPMIFMLIMPAWAMVYQLFIGSEDFPAWIEADDPNFLLIAIGIATILLEIWMIFEAVLLWPQAKGILEPTAEEKLSTTSPSGMNC
ncbi:Carbon starvation protein A [Poriferisphaera corsica]|uniref:Carbon starvation protein A n=1 Tax=Poriferisphaera corsica TaxID=2528020 RepID=A0A517YTN5_9BACT|nr:carbon starvation protein A [Poriferisphaera corsica]QDU33586.1 Carbon starvation protein A [Poriferisphaera corsica]